LVGVQVHVAELGDDEVENMASRILLDFVGKLEILEERRTLARTR